MAPHQDSYQPDRPAWTPSTQVLTSLPRAQQNFVSDPPSRYNECFRFSQGTPDRVLARTHGSPQRGHELPFREGEDSVLIKSHRPFQNSESSYVDSAPGCPWAGRQRRGNGRRRRSPGGGGRRGPGCGMSAGQCWAPGQPRRLHRGARASSALAARASSRAHAPIGSPRYAPHNGPSAPFPPRCTSAPLPSWFSKVTVILRGKARGVPVTG